VLDIVNTSFPVLGVPTGVKMHSAAFAVDPQAAARIAIRFLWEEFPLKEVEVMDVDEEAYRKGTLSAKLYGYMLTPYEPYLIQGAKIASPITETEREDQVAIAKYIIEELKPGVFYIIGPGTTTRPIVEPLGGKKTLLGVDLIYNRRLIAKDVNEKQILKAIKGKKARIIVTPIGGQGFIFGRGNLQISSTVIRQVGKNNVMVVATRHKIRGVRSLRVDTGDAELDEALRGYTIVKTGYREETAVRVE